MRSGFRSLSYLLVRTGINWLRRSYRSAIVWLLVIAVLLGSGTGLFLEGQNETGPTGEDPPVAAYYVQAGAVAAFLGMLLTSVWRGTRNPPRVSLADVVFILGSPLSRRGQYAFLMLREAGGSLVIIAAIVGVSLVGALARLAMTGEVVPGEIVDVAAMAIFVILFIGELVRLSIWVVTEQVVARDVLAGFRLRRLLRSGALGVGAGFLVLFLAPLYTADHQGWRENADAIADRIMSVGSVPPLSWIATLFGAEGSTPVAAGGLFLTAAIVTAAGVWSARDFAEPLSITAERQTDARGQMANTGGDVHWAAMSQLGASRRVGFSLPPFGRGPWALLWSSLLRWTRYQIVVAWISVISTVIIGGAVAIAVRLDIISHYWAWGAMLSMPLFNAYNLLLDELRKPFLYLTPGAAWKRLTAAGATSVLDGLFASLAIAIILLVSRARPLSEVLMLLVLSGVLAFVVQAAVGFVQVLLPSWLSRKIRTGLTYGACYISVIPTFAVFLIGYLSSGLTLGFVLAVPTALVSGTIVLALSVAFFDRLEMPA